MTMPRFSHKTTRMLQAVGTLALTGAALLPLSTSAEAGYDVDTIRTPTARSAPGYGTYVTTRTTGYITLVGTLTEDADDKNFDLRDAWGRTYNVETSRLVQAEAANKLQKGDMVRVYGEWRDNMLYATNIRTMASNA